MHCPACTFPAFENDAACRQCGFGIAMVDQQFGIPPVLARPVSDLSGTLGSSDEQAISAAVHSLEQRFPQIKAAVVLAAAPPNIPLPVYAFWLFNRGSLFSAVEKGGANHGILLLIETSRSTALLMPGYGLEPFVPEGALKVCLQAAAHQWHEQSYAAAATTCLEELGRQLTQLCYNLPKTFGYQENISGAGGNLESSDDLF